RRSVRHNACSAGAGGHLVRIGQRRIRAGHRVDSGAGGGAAARRLRPGRPGAVPYGQRAGSRAAGATGAAQGQRPSRRPAAGVTPGPFPPGQIYLGWQFALLYEDPGLPPRRPVPPDPERLNPGWVTAQRREGHLISPPAKRSAAGCLLLAGLVVLLGWAGRLDPAPARAGAVTLSGPAVPCAASGSRGPGGGRGPPPAGGRRGAAAARAAQQRDLFAAQEEHARRFRAWQGRQRAFSGQALWYPVSLPAETDRIDLVGGTMAGWSALLTTLAVPRLAAGDEVTV